MFIRRHPWTVLSGLAIFLAFLSACGNRENAIATSAGAAPSQQNLDAGQRAKADALVKEWFDLARAPKENLNNPRCRQIALELLDIRAEELKPIFEVVADPDAAIETKVLAVATLDCVVVPGVLPWLTTLVSPQVTADTRACAVQLLAVSRDPSVIPTLRSCASDPDKRTRLAALVGLMAQGDSEARKTLAAQFRTEGVGRKERARILTSFLSDPRAEDLPLFLASTQDAELPANMRLQAVTMVGRFGDASAVTALEQLAQTEQDEQIREFAKDAIAAIKSRQAAP